jgi:signal transduction histidine kinase
MRFHERPPLGATVLVGVVFALVPLLAWMQYRWVGQLSEAETERMQRTLRMAASQFAVEFDTELSRAMSSLQVEGPMLRDRHWTAYAQRYRAWAEGASDPRMVREVLLVDAGASVDVALPPFAPESSPSRPAPTAERFSLLKWDPASDGFQPIEWPSELSSLRASMAAQLAEYPRGFDRDRQADRERLDRGRDGPDQGPPRGGRLGAADRGRVEGALTQALSSDDTIVSPVALFGPPPDGQGPPRISILGFTILRLDPAVVRGTVLPALASRHLHGADSTAEYRVAVVARDNPARVIWESEPGVAATIVPAPDVAEDFMTPQPDRMLFFRRTGPGDRDAGRAPVPAENIVVSVLERREPGAVGVVTGESRVFSPFEGRWTLVAKHRAGSLEAAVSLARRRNLALSSGILVLLTLSVGLIVVSARRAQELARQQMEFVAAVSHELRTPVSVISTAAGNLADGVVADPKRVKTYGETIRAEARRLAETVERVLQLAGIAAGRAAAARTRVHPSALVNQAVEACRAEIDAADVEVEIDVAPHLPFVAGDVSALRSALQNLISNAVKYGGEAKWLRVSSRLQAPDSRLLAPDSRLPAPDSRLPASDRVVFTVEDRGLGIDADDRKHIFEPFYRGHEAVRRQIHGSGLGLNLVQRIVEAHGGTVSVSTEPGKGSTFTVTLPAAREAAQAEVQRSEVKEAGARASFL